MRLMMLGVGTRFEHVKAFKFAGWFVIGIDMDKNAPALQICDKALIIPHRFDEQEFWEELIPILKENEVDAVIPGSHFSVVPLNRRRAYIPTKVVLPDQEIVEICENKRMTSSFLEARGFLVVPSVAPWRELPCIMRPIHGAGNKMTIKLESERDYQYWKDHFREKNIEAMYTRYMDCQEYTVDYLASEDSEPVYVIPRKRIEHKSGEVWKTEVVKDTIMENLVMGVIRSMRLKYVGFVQLFKNTDREMYISEIDTRFGGGVTCSIHAGADMFGGLQEVLSGGFTQYTLRTHWEPAKFTRYLKDTEII